jgi:hypothetical protein
MSTKVDVLPALAPQASAAESDTPNVEAPSANPLRKTVSITDQSSRLPARKLAVVVVSLIFSIFLTSFEQTSVSTALPGIARDLGSSTAISWVGTAYLVAK